jgi:hypothetical protein
MLEISHPNAVTYYIVRSDAETLVTHGVLGSEQVCSTGQPLLSTYVEQADYLADLVALGVDVEDEEFLAQLAADVEAAESQMPTPTPTEAP